MQIQPISNQNYNPKFCGFLKVNKALREFKMSLNDAQQDLFENNIMHMEKENDGRVFKYDYLKDGTVGIFEKVKLPFAKPWTLLFQSPKDRAVWCFDQLNDMYKSVI